MPVDEKIPYFPLFFEFSTVSTVLLLLLGIYIFFLLLDFLGNIKYILNLIVYKRKEQKRMKFSCEKSTLLDAIHTASRAVSTKSTIAILEGLKITADEKLTITGYDLAMGIRTCLDADIVQIGEIVLNAKILGDIIRKLPDDIIFFETDEKLLTTIKCGRAIFNLVASTSDDFPQMPEVNCAKQIKMSQPMLKSMIAQTIFAVSDNEAKPIHTGCLFEIEQNHLNVVAVDGYRLSVRREILENSFDNMKFVVPGNALREIERILSDNSEKMVSIYPDEKHILFEIDQTIFITRLIDGEFLNYRAAIPQKSNSEVTVNTQDMINSIERVSLIVSEKLKNPVRMHFDGPVIKMSCITAIGKSYDECPIDSPVDNLEIGFNNKYLLDALRACDDEKIKLSLGGALNPMVIHAIDSEKFTYLVLPVRLKSGE